MPLYGRLFLFREDDDRCQNADGAEQVIGAEGDVQQSDGEQDGGEGFGRAEDARLTGLDVLETPQVAAKGDDRAEDDDVGKEQQGCKIHLAAKIPGPGNGQKEQAAQQHAPARDERHLQMSLFGWTV